MYLDICTLHQFGAPVRAGLISRVSGIRFEQFQTQFMASLENVVPVVEEGHNRDFSYRSRHQHIAEIVFTRMLPVAGDKFDPLVRVLKAINVDYSSDRETFSRLIRGRGIAEIFPSADLGRLSYDHVQKAMPNDPFILHQLAVFEMQHPGGLLVRAEAAAARAFELNSNSHSIRHTQAEISRRLANDTDDPLRKRVLRLTTRKKLGKNTSQLTEYDLSTYACLAIDEFKELLASLDISDDKPLLTAFIGAAKETETAIQHGLQRFPRKLRIARSRSNFQRMPQSNCPGAASS